MADGVGQDAIDFLGHRTVEAAQTGLDMRDTHAQLDGRQSTSQGRVYVADDDHGVRPLFDHDRLKPPHHLGRLHGVRCGADLQIEIRLGDLELVKE